MEKKTYCVRFFTRSNYDDKELASFYSNTVIPIPRVGEVVLLDDDESVIYRVTEVENIYPYQSSDAYDFESDIIVEVTD